MTSGTFTALVDGPVRVASATSVREGARAHQAARDAAPLAPLPAALGAPTDSASSPRSILDFGAPRAASAPSPHDDSAAAVASPPASLGASGAPEVEVFFDGECPFCVSEMRLVARLDARGAVRLTDIAAPAFDPAPLGRTRAEVDAAMHARLSDGRVVTGVEAFRQLYAALGFRWLVRVSRWAPLAWLLDRAYAWFAPRRVPLGRAYRRVFGEARAVRAR